MTRCRTLFLLIPLVLLAACRGPDRPASYTTTETFPALPGKLVRLATRSLDAVVEISAGDTIRVEVEIRARSSSRRAAERWVETHRPTIEDTPAVLDVRVPESSHGVFLFGTLHTDGTVHVVLPPGCRVEVDTSSGDVTIGGDETLADPVNVTTRSGDVTVTGGVGQLVARTSSGDLQIRGDALQVLEARSSSGDVTLKAGAARAIVDTTSGDIRLEDLTGSASVHAGSGDVRAVWKALPVDARLQVVTSSGDISLRWPSDARVRGDVSARSGTVHSAFEGSWGRRRHELRFETAGDAAALEVRSGSGEIALRAAAP